MTCMKHFCLKFSTVNMKIAIGVTIGVAISALITILACVALYFIMHRQGIVKSKSSINLEKVVCGNKPMSFSDQCIRYCHNESKKPTLSEGTYYSKLKIEHPDIPDTIFDKLAKASNLKTKCELDNLLDKYESDLGFQKLVNSSVNDDLLGL